MNRAAENVVKCQLRPGAGLSCLFIAFLTAVGCVGCNILPAPPADGIRHFVLSNLPCDQEKFTVPQIVRTWVDTSASLQTSAIMYEKSRLERGFYQYAFWIEPVPDRLKSIVEDALTCHGIYSSQKNGRVLKLFVRDFYHKAMAQPGEVVVRVDVTLLDGSGGSTIGNTQITSTKPVTAFSSSGAVEALDVATHDVVQQILSWLRTIN